MTAEISLNDINRWAESIAGSARTGLAFSENQYDRERFEELLQISGDMLSAISGRTTSPEEYVAGWLSSVANGVSGYVTPKVGVGAYVGNEKGELLLIQRSDTHKWFIPTGWADIGYSPSEVAVKEVAEECGLEVEVTQLISLFDGLRAGNPIPHYTAVFACKLIGGELKPHPLECDDVGWFAEDALPEPLLLGERWRTEAFAAIRGEVKEASFDAPRPQVWRTMPG